MLNGRLNQNCENGYSTKAIPIKILMTVFTKVEKSILRFIWKYK
jgi:hypothetical protein